MNGPSIDQKLMQVDSTGTYYFLQDHLDTTLAMVKKGALTVHPVEYELFGKLKEPALTRIGFTGRVHDEITRLVDLRARWYDPDQGRFLTEDPSGIEVGPNLYMFAFNNAVNFRDPFGLFPTGYKYGLGGLIHQNSIDRALYGYATPYQISMLKYVQPIADDDIYQTSAYAHAHAMRPSGVRPDTARTNSNNYIKEQIEVAVALRENAYVSLYFLGFAMHTLQDFTSPAHYYFRAWRGEEEYFSKWHYNFVGACHGYEELFDPGPGSNLDAATLRAWKYYLCPDSIPADVFQGLSFDKKPENPVPKTLR